MAGFIRLKYKYGLPVRCGRTTELQYIVHKSTVVIVVLASPNLLQDRWYFCVPQAYHLSCTCLGQWGRGSGPAWRARALLLLVDPLERRLEPPERVDHVVRRAPTD